MPVVSHTLRLLAVGLAVSATAVACRPAAAPRTISMRMVGSPMNASVTIDDIFVGRLDLVAARGVALPIGFHRISVEAPGYLPWDRIVEAKEGADLIRLDVHLNTVPE